MPRLSGMLEGDFGLNALGLRVKLTSILQPGLLPQARQDEPVGANDRLFHEIPNRATLACAQFVPIENR